ncbi:hypothetical protein L596_020361 [Steinernema carpocapsae]|uniref:Uncharacterized protein n=1 Tax=Steinernema carpocapsae TaxID=34508 RepID=A0A4U5MTA6_STECR|nr:hypothetical protein L596_020361 [Steinernema carpocapsae]
MKHSPTFKSALRVSLSAVLFQRRLPARHPSHYLFAALDYVSLRLSRIKNRYFPVRLVIDIIVILSSRV